MLDFVIPLPSSDDEEMRCTWVNCSMEEDQQQHQEEWWEKEKQKIIQRRN